MPLLWFTLHVYISGKKNLNRIGRIQTEVFSIKEKQPMQHSTRYLELIYKLQHLRRLFETAAL